MYRSYELRLKPTEAQVSAFEEILADCCETYNAALQERKEAYKLEGKSISYMDQCAELTELRKDPQFAKIAVDIQRDPLRRLSRAFDGFFRRCRAAEKPGFPRYRARARYDSFAFSRVRIKGREIKIPNVGWFKFKKHQVIEGLPKMATIKRIGKKWIVRLTCDLGPAPEKRVVETATGIDLGLTDFITCSDGTFVPNPKFVKQHEDRIAAANRRLALKKSGSKNRIKAKEQLRRAYQRMTDARKNFCHHVSKQLVNS